MINLEQISFSYGDKSVLTDFNLSIEKGEILTIVGPNGCGKSTILKNITKKLKYNEGEIYIEDENVKDISMKKMSKKLSLLSQHHSNMADFTVKQLVHYGRVPHKKWYEVMNKKDSEQVEWAMKRTGVDKLADKPIGALSGGERQRVWIAMALAQDPKILLLDEPTTYLDICHQLEVLDLVKELNDELGMTVVMVLHDLNQACRYSHRVCVMKDGKIKSIGKPEKIFTSSLIKDVYSVEAVVANDEDGKVNIRPIKVYRGGKKDC